VKSAGMAPGVRWRWNLVPGAFAPPGSHRDRCTV